MDRHTLRVTRTAELWDDRCMRTSSLDEGWRSMTTRYSGLRPTRRWPTCPSATGPWRRRSTPTPRTATPSCSGRSCSPTSGSAAHTMTASRHPLPEASVRTPRSRPPVRARPDPRPPPAHGSPGQDLDLALALALALALSVTPDAAPTPWPTATPLVPPIDRRTGPPPVPRAHPWGEPHDAPRALRPNVLPNDQLLARRWEAPNGPPLPRRDPRDRGVRRVRPGRRLGPRARPGRARPGDGRVMPNAGGDLPGHSWWPPGSRSRSP